MDIKELDAIANAMAQHALTLPPGEHGRQRDAGAKLVPAGYSMLLHFTDPSRPGVIYTADEEDLAAGRLSAHRRLLCYDGDVMNDWNASRKGRGGLKVLDIIGVLLGSKVKLPAILAQFVGLVQQPGEEPAAGGGTVADFFSRLFGRGK